MKITHEILQVGGRGLTSLEDGSGEQIWILIP
jgi:hypothetical protein